MVNVAAVGPHAVVQVGFRNGTAPIPGFGVKDCDALLESDEARAVVSWGGRSDTAPLVAKERLTMVVQLTYAELFSWEFRCVSLKTDDVIQRDDATDASPPAPAPPIPYTSNIVVGVDVHAPVQEQFAAEQLSRYLSGAVGHTVPVMGHTTAERHNRPYIAVGATAALHNGVALSLLRQEATLGLDGMLCRSRGLPTKAGQAVLILTGGVLDSCVPGNCSEVQPRGTINACFEYLRMAGTRILALNATVYRPITKTLPGCDFVWKPSYDFRMLNQYSATYNKWNGGPPTPKSCRSPSAHCGPKPSEGFEGSGSEFWVANHLNGVFGFLGCAGVSDNVTARSPCAPLPRPIRPAWGGSTVYAGKGFHHTSFLMVPPEIYNRSHPGWFGGQQLCWGNESLVDFVTQVSGYTRRLFVHTP
jgi:hypothetical protein